MSGVFCANLWLIASLVVLGGILGVLANMYLARNYSRYTASGLVQIAEKAVGRVTDQGGKDYVLDMSTLSVEQRSQAAYLRTDALLNAVLTRPAVRDTTWFILFIHSGPGGNDVEDIHAAMVDLADKLSVQPLLESKYIEVEFSYSVPADCATIVRELVEQGLDDQGATKSSALRIRTQDLNLAKSTLTLKSNRLKDDIAKLQLDLNKEGVNTMQGMVGALPQEMSGLSQQQSEDQRLYNLANSKLQQFQAQLERGEDPAEIEKELHQDQQIQMLHLKVDDAEQGMTELGSVGPNSPRAQQYQQQVVMLEKQLADAEAERRVALRAELKSQLEQEKDAAESGLQAVAHKISELKDAQGELDFKLFQFFQSKEDQEATDVQLQNIQKQIDNIENETHDKDLAGVASAVAKHS